MNETWWQTGTKRPGDVASAVVHMIGGGLALSGLPFLALACARRASTALWVGFAVYAAGILFCFAISAVYHLARRRRDRPGLEALDAGATFCLAAASWTPFCLTSLAGTLGWTILGLLWGLGAIGFLSTLFLKAKPRDLALGLYYLAFALLLPLLGPVHARLGETAWPWLILAGFLFTSGLFFRSRDTMPYHHGIWHAFMVCASTCQYFAVLSIAL
jgi:hemolysin III